MPKPELMVADIEMVFLIVSMHPNDRNVLWLDDIHKD